VKKKQVVTLAKMFLDQQDWVNEKALGKKIKAWLQEKKISKTAELVLSVPSDYAVMHRSWVPIDEKSFADYLRWDLAQYLGSSVDDYVLGYQTTETNNKSGYIEYQVGAYQKSEVIHLKKLFHFSDMPLTVVDVDAFALQNAYEVNYPENHPYHSLIIKADFNAFGLLHVYKSRFLDYHVLPMPDNYLTQSEDEKISCLRGQANRLLKFYQQSFLGTITGDPLMLLCGDLASDPAFLGLLRDQLGQEIQLLNPFKEVRFPYDPEYESKVKEASSQCAVALGLALRTQGDNR